MTLRSDPSLSSQAGFTLFETLLTLGILSLLLAVVAGAARGPSPSVELHRLATQVQSDAAAARLRAIETGRAVRFSLEADTCEGRPAHLDFAPDGSVAGDPVCVRHAGLQLTLSPAPLSGRLVAQEGTP